MALRSQAGSTTRVRRRVGAGDIGGEYFLLVFGVGVGIFFCLNFRSF